MQVAAAPSPIQTYDLYPPSLCFRIESEDMHVAVLFDKRHPSFKGEKRIFSNHHVMGWGGLFCGSLGRVVFSVSALGLFLIQVLFDRAAP